MDILNEQDIEKIKSGDQEVFELVFKKYYSLLCYIARGYFKNHYLIEEIVCDVFTRIWQNRSELTISVSLKEYLIKAVQNNCINYYRIQKVQEKLKQQVETNQKKAYSLADIGEDPLEYTIRNELEDILLQAVSSLPERTRQAFELSRYGNLTYEEIASKMGISINGVKVNIKNALAQLRVKLIDYLTIALIVSGLIK